MTASESNEVDVFVCKLRRDFLGDGVMKSTVMSTEEKKTHVGGKIVA